MSRIYDNGIYREMTEEELALNVNLPEEKTEITDAERIEALEAAIIELAGVIFNG